VDGSYYNYFGSDDSLIPTAWSSTDAAGTTTAEFTYCVDLSQTTATSSCAKSESGQWATIDVDGTCKLNTSNLSGTSTNYENK